MRNAAPKITELQNASDGSKKYGYVSYTGTGFSPVGPDFPLDGINLDAGETTIRWEGLTFTKAGQKFTTTIKNVSIQEDGETLTFDTRIGLTTATLDADDDVKPAPILYITKTESGAVEFKVDDRNYTSFSAAQELPAIKFTFQAIDTSIKDGQVRFTLPSGWTRAVAPHEDDTDGALGRLSISGGGFVAKTDSTKGLKKTRVTVGGTVTVGVPELPQGETMTITLNDGKTGDDEIKKTDYGAS